MGIGAFTARKPFGRRETCVHDSIGCRPSRQPGACQIAIPSALERLFQQNPFAGLIGEIWCVAHGFAAAGLVASFDAPAPALFAPPHASFGPPRH